MTTHAFSFADIAMTVPDVFRAQYFIEVLEDASTELITFFQSNPLGITRPAAFLQPFFSSLAKEIDRMILPMVAYEVAIAKKLSLLEGPDSRARYESFFVRHGKYTGLVRSLLHRYPSLFAIADSVIQDTTRSALACMHHLAHDLALLREHSFVAENDRAISLDILGQSDPHFGCRSFVVHFEDGRTVIHKPVDLTPDQLYGEFLERLNLPYPYDLKAIRVIPVNASYGWIESIARQDCASHQQLQNFYRRAGTLVAVADCLNYTDGHFENLIAAGAYPILLDGETFFQNYTARGRKEGQKNLLATSLVQKPPTAELELGYAAALQSPPSHRYEVVSPFALYDQTDELELRYRGLSQDTGHNCPRLNGQPQTLHKFVDEIVEGFSFGFDHIKCRADLLFHADTWWERVGQVRSRTILRDTMAYAYLIRRIQRPEACMSTLIMESIITAKLGDTPYSRYEMKELMNANIPYFYHHPSTRDLYQGDGEKHPAIFLRSGIQALKKQLTAWDDPYREYSIELLQKHLPLTPVDGTLTYHFLLDGKQES